MSRALGVVTFEMCHGYTPFSDGGRVDDVLQLYRNISHPDFKVGYDEALPKPLLSFVKRLLRRNPAVRLGAHPKTEGAMGGAAAGAAGAAGMTAATAAAGLASGACAVRDHEWLAGVPWDAPGEWTRPDASLLHPPPHGCPGREQLCGQARTVLSRVSRLRQSTRGLDETFGAGGAAGVEEATAAGEGGAGEAATGEWIGTPCAPPACAGDLLLSSGTTPARPLTPQMRPAHPLLAPRRGLDPPACAQSARHLPGSQPDQAPQPLPPVHAPPPAHQHSMPAQQHSLLPHAMARAHTLPEFCGGDRRLGPHVRPGRGRIQLLVTYTAGWNRESAWWDGEMHTGTAVSSYHRDVLSSLNGIPPPAGGWCGAAGACRAADDVTIDDESGLCFLHETS